MNGTLFFTRTDPTDGLQLWKSDGTTPGTVKVRGWSPGEWVSADPHLTNVNGTLFFVANDGFGPELWRSDGTASGTVLAADINPGPGGSDPSSLTNFNGVLVFTANDGKDGYQLWKSDGTAAGTTMVTNLKAASTDSLLGVHRLWAVGRSLFFAFNESVPTGAAIPTSSVWVTDATPAGTHVTNLGIDLEQVVSVNGTLFMSTGTSLWRTDGTAAGSVLLTTASTSFIGSLRPVDELTNVNGTLYFTENDRSGPLGEPGHGWELWKTDGTPAGTVMVRDIRPGPDGSDPNQLTNVNGTLFFSANDGVHGERLWKSDGTQAGTVMMADVDGTQLVNVNGALFFTTNDAARGPLVWKSDGTSAGTVIVQDRAGVPSAGPGFLGIVNGFLYYSVLESVKGPALGADVQLWRTDGTPSGTSEVATFHEDFNVEPVEGQTPPPTTLSAVGAGASSAVFAVTPGNALYRYDAATGWKKLGDGVESISAVMERSSFPIVGPPPKIVVFAITTDHALFRFDDHSGWKMLGAPNTIQSISAGTDASGLADVFVIGGDTALCEWSTSSGWLAAPIGSRGSIESISATNNNRVVVVTTDHSVFEHDQQFGWFGLASSGFARSVSAATDGLGRVVVFARTQDNALFRHDEATGWARLGASGTIQTLSAGKDANGQANVFVVTNNGDLAEHDLFTGWSLFRSLVSPTQLSAAGVDRVFAVSADGSIFGHVGNFGFFNLTAPGFAGS